MAILAMDSYNRGYEMGLKIDEGSASSLGQKIGTATLIDQSNPNSNSTEVAKGFYTSAYNLDGKVVISYRGMVS